MVNHMELTRDDINSMTFSTFVQKYPLPVDFVQNGEHYTLDSLDVLMFKIEDALEPIKSFSMDNFDKDYSMIEAAKDNLSMVFDDYEEAVGGHPSFKVLEHNFMAAMNNCLKEAKYNCGKSDSPDVAGIIAQTYVVENFNRERFTHCSESEMADNICEQLSDFFDDKKPYLALAGVEGLFPEDTFKQLRDKNKDPYSYYEYQMSVALDENYTHPQPDKRDHFKLEYYLDGLRSIVGNGDFSQQNLYCVDKRLTNELNAITNGLVEHKNKQDLSSCYLCVSDAMDDMFISNADKIKSIDSNLLREWFEGRLSQMRGDVVSAGFEGNGTLTEKDDNNLMIGYLFERYYDENFAQFGVPNLAQGEHHYRPHIMTAFLNSKTVNDKDKVAYYKKYRDTVCVDNVYDLDKQVGHKSWERSFTKFQWSNDSFSEYKSDYGVCETDLKNRRFLEDFAYAKGRGFTNNLVKTIMDSVNDINGSFDMVESNIADTVKFGKDFLANMNAVSGFAGDGIRKAFREADDKQSYSQTINSAI